MAVSQAVLEVHNTISLKEFNQALFWYWVLVYLLYMNKIMHVKYIEIVKD